MNRYAAIRTITVRADFRTAVTTATVTIADDLTNDDHIVLLNDAGAVVGWEDYETGALYTNTLFGAAERGTTELKIV